MDDSHILSGLVDCEFVVYGYQQMISPPCNVPSTILKLFPSFFPFFLPFFPFFLRNCYAETCSVGDMKMHGVQPRIRNGPMEVLGRVRWDKVTVYIFSVTAALSRL